MKELQVAKVRDFKGLLPTVRYRGRRNKKGNKKNKKKKKTKREKKKENGTRGDVVEKERERDRNRHTHTHTHTHVHRYFPATISVGPFGRNAVRVPRVTLNRATCSLRQLYASPSTHYGYACTPSYLNSNRAGGRADLR